MLLASCADDKAHFGAYTGPYNIRLATNKMKRLLFLFAAFTLFSATLCFAGESPKEVVAQFCELDFKGHRLSSATYDPIEMLIMYPAEPGWDTVLGVHSYLIQGETIEGNTATVVVDYEIDRSWPDAIKDTSNYQVETFSLQHDKGSWKLTKYSMLPRVSAEFLCKQYKYCTQGS